MGRIRTIKPEFWTDEELSELPPETHMLAAALLNYADDEGYFNANPKLVKASCAPLREDSVRTHDSLQQLANIGYLMLGTGSDGKRYGFIVGFEKHQRVNRPTPSKIKVLTIDWEGSGTAHGGFSECSSLEGNREQGKEVTTSDEVVCAEQQIDGQILCSRSGDKQAEPQPGEPPVITIPLNDGSEFPVTGSDIAEWRGLYPAVDVLQALRNMRGWCLGNPKKRKTRSGVKAFIANWLAKDQNRGGATRPAQTGNQRRGGFDQIDYEREAQEMGFRTEVD